MEGGGEEIIYLSLHCHHRNDSSIKTGSDESHCNISYNCVGKIHKSVHRPQLLKKKESRSGFEPRPLRLPGLPLGRTGSTIIKLAITLNRSCAPRWRYI